MVPVSVAELKEHIGFLRAVHIASGAGEKSLYADGPRLRTAVRVREMAAVTKDGTASAGDVYRVAMAAMIDCVMLCKVAEVWELRADGLIDEIAAKAGQRDEMRVCHVAASPE